MGQGPSRSRFRVCGGTVAPHMPVGTVCRSLVAGVLGNKLVKLGDSLLPMLITLSAYSFGVE
jgi:hypothetical protein